MGRFLESVRRGLRAARTPGPVGHRFAAATRTIACAHCGGDRFVRGTAQLNTAGMSFLNLDWTDRSATTLACAECSRVEWYLEAPEQLDEPD